MNLTEQYLNYLSEYVSYNNIQTPRPRYYGADTWRKWIPDNTVISPKLIEDPSNIWIWSDLHFSHKNIIKYSGRPFSNPDEMNHKLIENFNSKVKETDISIWVGDVGFCSDNEINQFLSYCNGYKILVLGNHDFMHGKCRKLNFDEIYVTYELSLNDKNFIFTHYPFELEGYINIHGHEHKHPDWDNESFYNDKKFNVNCEFINYHPIQLKNILEKVDQI